MVGDVGPFGSFVLWGSGAQCSHNSDMPGVHLFHGPWTRVKRGIFFQCFCRSPACYQLLLCTGQNGIRMDLVGTACASRCTRATAPTRQKKLREPCRLTRGRVQGLELLLKHGRRCHGLNKTSAYRRPPEQKRSGRGELRPPRRVPWP